MWPTEAVVKSAPRVNAFTRENKEITAFITVRVDLGRQEWLPMIWKTWRTTKSSFSRLVLITHS